MLTRRRVAASLAVLAMAANPEPMAEQRQETTTGEAIALMEAYGERTGLTSDRPQSRYLWTDAFAVCNLVGLSRVTGEAKYLDLALELVDTVHETLGRYRDDDPRAGWISGLDEDQARQHPTRGGLRIGKPLPERGPGEPVDPSLEWERDGQYFHYLTKWMHALDVAARASGRARLNLWARELAETAHAAFSYLPAGHGRPRMYWKMSTDLERPLVPSMGQHDPLDGLVTSTQLAVTAGALSGAPATPSLTEEIEDFAVMTEALELVTADPLGLGGLLTDACRVTQLMERGAFDDGVLAERLLTGALTGVRHYAGQDELDRPAGMRLAFRELGLAIGLHCVERMLQAPGRDGFPSGRQAETALHGLAEFKPLRDRIETFWRRPENRRARTWTEHRDINEVMLATALVPEGCLVLPPAS